MRVKENAELKNAGTIQKDAHSGNEGDVLC